MTDELQSLGGNAQKQLQSYVERIERVNEQKAGLSADVREIVDMAKGNGFDAKLIRRVVAERKRAAKMTPEDWESEQNLFDIYLDAARGA